MSEENTEFNENAPDNTIEETPDIDSLLPPIESEEEEVDTTEETKTETEETEETKPTEKTDTDTDVPTDLLGEEETEEEEEVELLSDKELEAFDEKARDAYKAMRLKIKEQKEALVARTTEDADGKADWEKERDQYRERVERLDYMNSHTFKTQHLEGIKTLQGRIANVAKEYGIDPQTAMRAAKMKSRERSELLNEESDSPNALSELLPMYTDLATRTDAANLAIKDHKAAMVAETADLEKQQTDVLNNALKALQDDGHFLLKESKTNKDWQSNLVAGAKKIISGKVSAQELASMALKAQTTDYLKSMYLKDVIDLRKDNEKLKAQLVKRGEMVPKLSDSLSIKSKKKDLTKATTIEELMDM